MSISSEREVCQNPHRYTQLSQLRHQRRLIRKRKNKYKQKRKKKKKQANKHKMLEEEEERFSFAQANLLKNAFLNQKEARKKPAFKSQKDKITGGLFGPFRKNNGYLSPWCTAWWCSALRPSCLGLVLVSVGVVVSSAQIRLL